MIDTIGTLSRLFKEAAEFTEVQQNCIQWREVYHDQIYLIPKFKTQIVTLQKVANTPIWAGYSDKTSRVYYWKENVEESA